jgi:hypothetical protein
MGESAKATLIVKRTHQWANWSRAIKLRLNGTELGTIRDGETKEYTVQAGRNSLVASIDWCRTEPFNYEATADGREQLEVGCNLKGAWQIPLFIFTGLYWFLINPRKYLYLRSPGSPASASDRRASSMALAVGLVTAVVVIAGGSLVLGKIRAATARAIIRDHRSDIERCRGMLSDAESSISTARGLVGAHYAFDQAQRNIGSQLKAAETCVLDVRSRIASKMASRGVPRRVYAEAWERYQEILNEPE